MEHRKDFHQKKLRLQPHSEKGGYFVEIHRSQQVIELQDYDGPRNASTKIYLMLAADEEFRGTYFLHKNKSDIMHTFVDGWPVKFIHVTPDGNLRERILGPDLKKGQVSRFLIPGGSFKAAKVLTENTSYAKFPGEVPFTLLTEVATPGFDYRDRYIPKSREELKIIFPDLVDVLGEYIVPTSGDGGERPLSDCLKNEQQKPAKTTLSCRKYSAI